jgi:hypothetical protein
MKATHELTGRLFGKLMVIGRHGSDKLGKKLWSCSCACGAMAIADTSSLMRGKKLSCGCLKAELDKSFGKRAKPRIRHGMSKRPEYSAWKTMRVRCSPKATGHDLHNYFLRGIRVCERWQRFESFIEDMGFRPSVNHSVDRIDNDGNYEPGNCRWATTSEQQTNKRRSTRKKPGAAK